MKTQSGEIVKHYSLVTVSIIGAFFIVGFLLAQNVSAIEKDQSQVQQAKKASLSSEIQLSGSAYNQELLNRDCVLVDELICRNLRP